jgi:RND family efflux transporter MFP subunit
LTGGDVPANATGSGLNQLNQAKISLQDAQNNLDATKLYASISGTVMSISNQLGESVGSGTFITIADLSQSELQIYMDQNDWSNIKLGYVTNVSFDALPDQVFTGKVTQVSPQLVNIQGSAVVEGLVLLDQKQASGATLQLPLGVSASVDVIAAQANNVILVPVQALHQLSPGNYAVFVMTAGKPTLRIVTIGLQDSTFAEIKTGLKAGDVVTTGIQATTGGSQVTPP